MRNTLTERQMGLASSAEARQVTTRPLQPPLADWCHAKCKTLCAHQATVPMLRRVEDTIHRGTTRELMPTPSKPTLRCTRSAIWSRIVAATQHGSRYPSNSSRTNLDPNPWSRRRTMLSSVRTRHECDVFSAAPRCASPNTTPASYPADPCWGGQEEPDRLA